MLLIQDSVWEPLKRFLDRSATLFPVLLAVIVVIASGLILAWFLDFATRTMLRAVGFDRMTHRPGVSDALRRAGLARPPSAITGYIIRWIVVVFTLVAALSILSSEATDTVMGALVDYLPRLAAALLILVLGYAVSAFIARSVLLWAVNARVRGARWLARSCQVLMAVFFGALALENLGFGRDVALVVLAILLGGGVLSLALAYGMAGRDFARESLEHMLREVRDEDRDTLSHL
jgi:Mechanosensitive ion channel, conserved TM helix